MTQNQHTPNSISNEEKLRNQIEASVLRGIQQATVTHQETLQHQQNTASSDTSQTHISCEDRSKNIGTNRVQVAPDPPDIRSPQRLPQKV